MATTKNPMRREPIKWLENARLAVVAEVSFEAWPDDLGVATSLQSVYRKHIPADAPFNKDLAMITDRQFGERVGIFRLLDILQQEGVRTTFFSSGAIVEAFPETMKEAEAQGHEISSQNYRHEYAFMQTPEQHRADIQKTVAIWEKVLGHKPEGYLSPGVEPTEWTPEILADLGYKYWVDLAHDELPYTLRLPSGKELVVMAHAGLLNSDYFQYGMQSRSHRDVGDIWKDWFDLMYEEGEHFPSLFGFVLHPYLVGRPHMAKVLKEFLRYVKGHPGVWFTTHSEIVKWWLKNYKDSHVELWPNYGTGIWRRMAK